MKAFISLLVFVISIFSVFSKDTKKVEINDETVQLNGTPVFKLQRVKITYNLGFDNYYLSDLSNKKIAFIKLVDNDYYEFTFLDTEQKAEMDIFHKPVALAKYLVDMGILDEQNKITDESIDQFVLIVGRNFSANRNTNNTIIINNSNPTPAPAPRNSFNINVGH